MKRLISAVLCFAICVSLMPSAFASSFKDVSDDAWYAKDVESAVASGLVNGKNSDEYCPEDNLTYAEAIKLAACMNMLKTKKSGTLVNGEPWYQTYVDYCKDNGIIDKDYAYDENATRQGFAEIFSNSLPSEDLKEINSIGDNGIPDVPSDNEYADCIYKLYRAGITTGADNEHNYKPLTNIKRSEVAAIVNRMVNPEKRVQFTLEERAPEGEEWTIEVTWDEGIAPEVLEFAHATLYNTTIRQLAKTDKKWGVFDTTAVVTKDNTTFKFKTWPDQLWSIDGSCFCSDENYWYVGCTETDNENKIKKLCIMQLRPIPSPAVLPDFSDVTETPKPTVMPTETVYPDDTENHNITVKSGNKAETVGSLYKAQELARDYAKTAPVEVSFDENITIYSPLEFTEADNNAYKVTYKGGKNASVTGGRKVSSWVRVDGNIWKASYDGDVSALYVDGKTMSLANSLWTWDKDGATAWNYFPVDNKNGCITVPSDYINFDLANAKNATIKAVVEWVEYSLPVSSVKKDSNGNYVFKMNKEASAIMADRIGTYTELGIKKFQEFRVENIYDLMDSEGEYYYDGQNIYLYTAGDPNNKECIVPVTDGFIRINGSEKSLASNIEFDNISFKYGKSDLFKDKAYATKQANQFQTYEYMDEDYIGYSKIDKEIYVNYANHITFNGCEFADINATAIDINEYAYNVTVENCRIHDIGSAGIRVGYCTMGDDNKTLPSDTKNLTSVDTNTVSCLPKDILIKNNIIENIGTVYSGSAGIVVYLANNVEMSHNTLSHIAYSGISTGWGWGNSKSTNSCKSYGNIDIKYNHISSYCERTVDGGVTYNLGACYPTGRSYGLEITNNYFEMTSKNNNDDGSIPMRGIYFDDGSESCMATDNVVEVGGKYPETCLYLMSRGTPNGEGMKRIHILFDRNYTNATNYNDECTQDGEDIIVKHPHVNIDLSKSEEAQKIIKEAGSSLK